MAMGVKVLGENEGFEWSEVADGGFQAAGARAAQPSAVPAQSGEATVRVQDLGTAADEDDLVPLAGEQFRGSATDAGAAATDHYDALHAHLIRSCPGQLCTVLQFTSTN